MTNEIASKSINEQIENVPIYPDAPINRPVPKKRDVSHLISFIPTTLKDPFRSIGTTTLHDAAITIPCTTVATVSF